MVIGTEVIRKILGTEVIRMIMMFRWLSADIGIDTYYSQQAFCVYVHQNYDEFKPMNSPAKADVSRVFSGN